MDILGHRRNRRTVCGGVGSESYQRPHQAEARRSTLATEETGMGQLWILSNPKD